MEEIQTEFRRDLHHNYLILSGGRKLDRMHYEIRMMELNNIPGLLKSTVQEMDGRTLYYYDITSRQPLSIYLETHLAGRTFLQLLLRSLQQVMERMSDYLLDSRSLYLQPEKIYLDASGESIWFCFFPPLEEPFSGQIKELGEYLLPRLDHEDPEGVVLGYAFYQKVSAVGTVPAGTWFDSLLNEPEAEKRRKPEEEKYRTETVDEKPEQQETEPHSPVPGVPDLFSAFFRPETEHKKHFSWENWKGRILWILPPLSAAAAGTACWRYLNRIPEGIAAGACAACLSVLMLYRRKQQGEAEGDQGKTEGRKAVPLFPEFPENGGHDEREAEQSLFHDTGGSREEGSGRQPEEQPYTAQEETVFLGSLQIPDTEPSLRARLVPEPEGTGAIKELRGDLYLLGKSEEVSDICIPSPAVSRLHARLLWDGKTYRILDLNSRNGTFRNEALLNPGMAYPLSSGDTLRLADRSFRYEQQT